MTTWQHFHSVPAGSSYPTSPSEPIFANLSAFHEILSSVTLWQSHSFFFSYLRGVITRSRVLSPKYHCRSIFCFLLLLSPSQSRLAGLLLGISTILLHSPSRAIPSLSYTVLFEWYFPLCLNTFLPLKQSLISLSSNNFLIFWTYISYTSHRTSNRWPDKMRSTYFACHDHSLENEDVKNLLALLEWDL